ncbi:MAG: 30S ribosomal protein S17 [Gaiellaceae bacterium]
MADDEKNEQEEGAVEAPEEQELPVEAEASETPSEPDPEAPPEEPGPPVPEPTAPEPTPEPAPEPIAEGEPEAAAEAEAPAEGEEAPEDTAGAGAEEAPAPAASTKKKRKRIPRSERRKRPKTRERATERKPITRLEKPEHERGRRQERRGVVVSAAMDKTIVVRVDVVKAHPKYKKVVRRSQRFHAHDEQNQAKTGDVVRIVETRPLSKTKNWRLAEVVEVAQ